VTRFKGGIYLNTDTNIDDFIASATEPETEAVVDAVKNEVDKASNILTSLGDTLTGILPALISAIIMLVLGIAFSKFIAHFVSKALKRSAIDHAAQSFLISLVRIILYVVVIMMALTMLNVPMSSIITVFGAAGLAISLALQNCLSNLCGGFIILFSKPFSAGDTIELDGSVGVVKSISILYTKMVTPDNKTIFIPNGTVSDAKIINYTESPTRRADMRFDISYDADFEKAQKLINDVISNDELILKEPAPVVRMSSHNESSISIDVLVWMENDNYRTVRYNLYESVKAAFDRNNIEIPYNQLDVHIKER
jgi:small conductance mechanosensitive channel